MRVHQRPILGGVAALALFGCSESGPSREGGSLDSRDSGAGSTQTPEGGPVSAPPRPTQSTLVLPGAVPGIGFDDLQYSARLDRLIVPAGRAGYVGLVEPLTETVEKLEGFSVGDAYTGGHDFGTTSAVEAEGLVYAIDRTAQELRQVDPESGDTLAVIGLAAAPDYVRFVSGTRELWVTEPAGGQFEIFALGDGDPPALSVSGTMAVAGGPESAVAGVGGDIVYTNSFGGETIRIDAAARVETGRWGNGCALSLGLAVDEASGLAFVGCPEGKAVALSLETGEVTSTLTLGSGGVDIIAYSPTRAHLYLNGSTQGELTIAAVDGAGTLTLVATEPTAPSTNSSCVASDPYDDIWVCDANAGQLLRFTDAY